VGRSFPLVLLKPVADSKLNAAWVKGGHCISEIWGRIIDLECAEVVKIQEVEGIEADFQGIAAANIELLRQVEFQGRV
jgi:hypothetical protein